ncbi:MAG TPA: glycosyltransferase family 39 protein, partial [Dehalococcoidia bacterium]
MERTVTTQPAAVRRLRRGWVPPWLLGLALVLALTALLRAPSLLEPAWHDDEGIFAALGKRVVEGGVLYVDAWDNKPPLVYLVFAAWYGLFGYDVPALRVLTALAVVGTQLAVFGLGWRLWGTGRGLAAALLYGVLASTPFFQGNGSFTETFLVLPAAAGMLAYVLGRERSAGGGTPLGYTAAAGLLLGLAFQFKQVAALEAAALGLFVLAAEPRPWRQVAALAAGWLAPWAAVTAYFAASGALGAYLYAILGYYVDQGYLGAESRLPAWASPLRAVAPLLAAGVVLARRRAGGLRTETLVSLWLVFAAVGTVMSGRDYPHYLLQALPPAALAAVRPLPLRRLQRPGLASAAAAGVLGALMGMTFISSWMTRYPQISTPYYENAAALLAGRASVAEYRAFFEKGESVEWMRRYLEEQGLAGRTVYV